MTSVCSGEVGRSDLVEPKTRILLVDPFEVNHIVFRATFQEYFEITTAISPSEAFGILERMAIDIVVSEDRFSEDTTGRDFFAQLKRQSPSCGRIFVVAVKPPEGTIFSLAQGCVIKPWNREQLLSLLFAVDVFRTAVS